MTLNTPKAFAALYDLRSASRERKASGRLPQGRRAADRPACSQPARNGHQFRPASFTVDESKVNGLIEARAAARKAKDFKESDRIRDELAAMGVVLKDSKDGTTWEVAR